MFRISIILAVLFTIIVVIIHLLSAEEASQVWEPPYKATFLRIWGALEIKIVILFCPYPGEGDWFVSTSAAQ